jgi:hypothetical protein
MESQETDADGSVSVDVGTNVSRRSLVKQIGAASAALGLAGCQTQSDETPTSGDDGDSGGGGQSGPGGADFEFSRHRSNFQ